ncbi:MAG: hypothetical protein ACUVQK_04115 [Thermogutta sp.]
MSALVILAVLAVLAAFMGCVVFTVFRASGFDGPRCRLLDDHDCRRI